MLFEWCGFEGLVKSVGLIKSFRAIFLSHQVVKSCVSESNHDAVSLSSNSSFKAKGHRAVCQQALRIGLLEGTSTDDGLIWMDMIGSRHCFLLNQSDTTLQEEFLKVGHRFAPALRQFEQHMTRLMLLALGCTISEW